MYRIRFHGRGGQGVKTASRILGSAFFREGFEVQDAPRYGAERRGAPIFAYVRADRAPVLERGVINNPDLVVVCDDSLVQVPAAGVLEGVNEKAVLLIASAESPEVWRKRLNLGGEVLTLPPASHADAALIGATCAGAAARLVGAIPRDTLAAAIRHELVERGEATIDRNLRPALGAFDAMADREGCAAHGTDAPAGAVPRPDWVDLEFEPGARAAPDVRAGGTSVQVKTGLWRTRRPVIDKSICNRCSWLCSTFCPDGAIDIGSDREPIIDYDHCKGCMICVAICPPHAIYVMPEPVAAREHHEPAVGEAP